MTTKPLDPRASVLARQSLLCLIAASFAAGCEALPDDETFDDEVLKAKPGLCIDDECVDGQADIRLRFTVANVTLRENDLQPGDRLRVAGREVICEDSPCATDSVFVRTLNSNKLIGASFGDPIPTGASSPNSLLAPLYVAAEDQGLCAPYDSGCEDDTVYQRQSLDVISTDDEHEGFARVLDGGNGWAPGGFHVSVNNWLFGNASCQLSLQRGSVTILRDACDADDECPEPDVVDSCESRMGPYDFLDAFLLADEAELYDTYDGECEVLSFSKQALNNNRERIDVDLDCVYTDPPSSYF